MQKLVDGIHQFRSDMFRFRQELFDLLAGWQTTSVDIAVAQFSAGPQTTTVASSTSAQSSKTFTILIASPGWSPHQ